MTHGHDVTVPLHDAPYVAAFHQGDCIKMVGLPDEMLARAVYELMSQKWPKLLFDRRCLNVSSCITYSTVLANSWNGSSLPTVNPNTLYNAKIRSYCFLR